MKLAIIPVTPFQQNCSLVICPATHRAAFVDPGGEVDRLFEVLAKRGATLQKVLVTHGHIDHCGGVAEVAARAGVPIEGPHPDDSFWIDQLEQQGRMFGVGGARHFTPDRWLQGGDEVTVGEMRFQVWHCPGHTPGHVIFAKHPVWRGICRRRAVPGLDRAHRLPARGPRDADPLDHHPAVAAG